MIVSVPGKLMLAGEYAALLPRGLAIAVAVDQRLEVEATPAEEAALSSALLGLDRAPLASDAPTGDRVLDPALTAARAAVAASGRAERPHHYAIRSALSEPGEAKPGLGSSAAVTVALIGAVLKAHGEDLGDDAVRQRVLGLALVAHTRAQGFRGSGYDVATSTFGGAVRFRGPAGAPLAERVRAGVAAAAPPDALAVDLVAAVEVQAAAWPDGLHGLLVPSGRSASTTALVQRAKAADPAPLAEAAERVSAALESGDPDAALDAIEGAQQAFEAWDRRHDLGLVAPLADLCREARQTGLVPRISGAGGGDSIVVLARDAPALARQADAWRARGLSPLPLRIAADGLRADEPRQSSSNSPSS